MRVICKLQGCNNAIPPDKQLKGHLFCCTEHRRAYRELNPGKPKIKHIKQPKLPKISKRPTRHKKTTLKPHEVLAKAMEAGLTIEQLLKDPSLARHFE